MTREVYARGIRIIIELEAFRHKEPINPRDFNRFMSLLKCIETPKNFLLSSIKAELIDMEVISDDKREG